MVGEGSRDLVLIMAKFLTYLAVGTDASQYGSRKYRISLTGNLPILPHDAHCPGESLTWKIRICSSLIQTSMNLLVGAPCCTSVILMFSNTMESHYTVSKCKSILSCLQWKKQQTVPMLG